MRRIFVFQLCLAMMGGLAWGAPGPITAPLKALSTNPNYFTDGSGKAVYLTGSHTWNDFQDWGTDDHPQAFDFDAFVKMLVAHHHNMTLLWTVELPTFHGRPTLATNPPDVTVTPFPWQRTGPGLASDGKLKFDLTKFNQGYYDRLRHRVRQLNDAGIYAGVYFFMGRFLVGYRSAHDGYPFTAGNNINGIDGGNGVESETMTGTNAITAIQDAHVRKVIDTLNDMPNVLWIVSQEAAKDSKWWNEHIIATARAYEAGKPLQHPIGWGTTDVSFGGCNADLCNSDADWIAPFARVAASRNCGSGHPACKVVINDSDHSYWGIWNESPQANREFFWLNFTRGNQTLFMDPYVVYYPRENRNLCRSPVHGIGARPDSRWDQVRDTMGYIRGYAERMNLAAAAPRGDLTSTDHALVNISGPEYLVYAPCGGGFSVDLSGSRGELKVEWMNPATGVKTAGESVRGGATRFFTPPFNGDAVLYLTKSD